MIELGSAELRLGARAASTHLTEAVELSRDPEQLAIAARRLAIALTLAGDAERAVTAIEAAIDVVEPDHRELALLLEGEIWTHTLQAEPRHPRSGGASGWNATPRGSTARRPAQRLVLASLASRRAPGQRHGGRGRRPSRRRLADGRFVGDQQAGLVGLGLSFDLSLGLIAADALTLADAYVEQMLDERPGAGGDPGGRLPDGPPGWVALRRGAVAAAEADGRTALELLDVTPHLARGPVALGLLVEALIEGGDPEAAERAAARPRLRREIPPGLAEQLLLEARGRPAPRAGPDGEGIEDLIEFGRRDELWARAIPLASRWRSHAALALATMGDAERRARMALDDLERARRWGAASGIGVALRAVA